MVPNGSLSIVTACNDKFVPLLEGMIGSVRAQATSRAYTITVIDVGLSEKIRHSLEKEGVIVKQIPQSIPLPLNIAPETLSCVIRPYVPSLVPDAEFIMWIDSDVWLQSPSVIDFYCETARDHDVVIAAESDRSYPFGIPRDPQRQGTYFDRNIFEPRLNFLFNIYRVHYDMEYARYLTELTLLNDGLLCAKTSSPLWGLWGNEIQRCLSGRGERFYKEEQNRMADFMISLLTFNEICSSQSLKAAILPATFNWVCHLRLPVVNEEGKLCHPMYPHVMLDAVHLTANTKWQNYNLQVLSGSVSNSLMEKSLMSPQKIALT